MKISLEKMTAFCAVLADTCNVGKACKAVEISRTTAWRWREEFEQFRDAWDKAMKIGLTGLEDEMHRRAFEGVDEPLVFQGQFTPVFEEVRDEDGQLVLDDEGQPKMQRARNPDGSPKVASVKRFSDTLAIFLAKAHAPEKYRDNSKVELAGSLNLATMSDDDIRAELAALTAAGAVLPAPQQADPTPDDGSDCSDLY